MKGVWCGLVALALVPVLGFSGQPKGGDTCEDKIRNRQPAFYVRISVDQPDRVYVEGETLTITVQSTHAGYLYVFNRRPNGEWICILPNKFQLEARIKPGEKVHIPAPDADYVFRIRPPFGREILWAVVTERPLDLKSFDPAKVRERTTTGVDFRELKSVVVERKPATWAEHEVEIETYPTSPKQTGPRRVALLIGVGKFRNAHRYLRPLEAPQHDVQALREVLERYGQMDKISTLVDEQATAEAIRQAICVTLPRETRPGDEVLIYFSGHGARCADDNNDEPDGTDEYLVPHDAGFAVPSGSNSPTPISVILDDELSRWIQELDGRRVAVIVDACYGGGQSAFDKSLRLDDSGPLAEEESDGFDVLDDLDRELGLVKDLGAEVALLTSSHADELSFVCRDGKLSVMTRFLVEYLQQITAPVQLKTTWEYLVIQVPRYVEKEWGVRRQVPRLFGETVAERFFLKP
ncbi:MAG: caspase family protein [Thermoguttaceae bacterium]|nr:caspase family protein [Thermoguttaceae bacterium]MDW8079807.1 caspase family protein [Thermoguttaceae bacterium]